MTRPFHEVIKELASNEIIPLDDSEFGKDELCATLQRVASKAAADMTEKPIVRPRPNEVGNDNTPLSYKLIDLYDLPCNLKQEWQSSNKELYADERVLASGKC